MSVPYQIELLSHNGVPGRHAVSPFAGMILDIPKKGLIYQAGPNNGIMYEGREFTHAYDVEFPTNGFHCYRERVTTAPSKWALAQTQ